MRYKADLWELLDGLKVKCKICAHYCIISPGKRGFCKTRENINGELYTLIYNSLSSPGSNDPIEKKPLYHFFPGSNAFSIASIGCNFKCKHCQNWNISQSYPNQDGSIAEFSARDNKDFNCRPFPLSEISAKKTVARAKQSGCNSIAYTYNEPSIWFEYVRDCSILAKKEGIKNVLVTNGYSSMESNKEFVKFIDAANIDVKAFNDTFYKKIVGVSSMESVLQTAEYLKSHGILVEITYLIIPKENDDLDEIKEFTEWILNDLGAETPIHFSAYSPRYRIDRPRTPSDILLKSYEIAKNTGLYYVYLGNILAEKGSNTECHNCGSILIERKGYYTKIKNLKEGNVCGICGEKAHIMGEYIKAKRSPRFFF